MARKRIPPLSRFERSPMTDAMVNRILNAEPGELIRYGELSALAGDDVQHSGRHLLRSAREISLNQHGIATDAVTNRGVKRLDDSGAVDVGGSVTRKIGNASRRALRVLGTVRKPEQLDGERQKLLGVARLQVGLLRLFSGGRMRRKLIKQVENGRSLPESRQMVKDSLRIFYK